MLAELSSYSHGKNGMRSFKYNILFSFLDHDFPSVLALSAVFGRAAKVDTRCCGFSGAQINALQ